MCEARFANSSIARPRAISPPPHPSRDLISACSNQSPRMEKKHVADGCVMRFLRSSWRTANFGSSVYKESCEIAPSGRPIKAGLSRNWQRPKLGADCVSALARRLLVRLLPRPTILDERLTAKKACPLPVREPLVVERKIQQEDAADIGPTEIKSRTDHADFVSQPQTAAASEAIGIGSIAGDALGVIVVDDDRTHGGRRASFARNRPLPGTAPRPSSPA